MFKKFIPVLFASPLFFVLIFFPSSVSAATEISGGYISTTTSWTLSDSPVIITGTVTVIADTVLAISPGVEVRFNASADLIVSGSLQVWGNDSDPVIFTSNANITPGAWGHIYLQSSSENNIIDHAVIEYSQSLAVYSSDSAIINSRFQNNITGLAILGSSPEISDNIFENNTTAISINYGSPSITNNTITGGNTGLSISGAQNPVITDNAINTADWPVKIDVRSGSVNLDANTFTGAKKGIYVNYGNIAADTTWTNTVYPYVITGVYPHNYAGSVAINSGATLTLNPGAILKFEPGGNIAVGRKHSAGITDDIGTLIAAGTEQNKIVFTSIHDDLYGGDTMSDGNATTPTIPGQTSQDYLYFSALSRNSVVDHAVIRYRNRVYAFTDLLIIKNTLFEKNNVGATIISASPVFLGNVFKNNSYGLTATQGNPIIFFNEFQNNAIQNIYIDSSAHPILSSPDTYKYTYDNNTHRSKLGNYWSDYIGVDANSDGIGDTAYVIANGQDDFPLIAGIGNYSEIATSDPAVVTDELILKYEPILYFYKNEATGEKEYFYPMDVETYVKHSSLWSTEDIGDTPLWQEGSTTLARLTDEPASVNKNWYLQFSENLVNKEPDADKARTEFASSTDGIVKSGEYHPTYYAHKTTSSYEDSLGYTHEFIVLQYWYFYAFNDWGAWEGMNNHEGDWETVMVFLDKDAEEPKYVAYSQHHNEGEINPPLQYGSVRRSWDSGEIEKEGDQVKSFIARGSHANYPNNGDNGFQNIPGFRNDHTSNNGDIASSTVWKIKFDLNSDPAWLRGYKGRWGVDADDILRFEGFSGPQGPYYRESGDINMFQNPIEWAGITAVTPIFIVENGLNYFDLNKSDITLKFSEPLEPGTSLTIDEHKEIITKGENLDLVTLAPVFWSIDSSLADFSFELELSFRYSEQMIAELGIKEEDLKVYWHNEATDIWESLPSEVNAPLNWITITTRHFSDYAIGAPKWQDITDGVQVYKTRRIYNPGTGIKHTNIRFKNITDKNISGPLRILIQDISEEGVELLNYTGTTTDGTPYLEIDNPYNQCIFIGTEQDLPTNMPWLTKKILLKDGPILKSVCEQVIKKYPLVEDMMEYILAPNRFTDNIELEFRIPDKKVIHTKRGDIHVPEFLDFDFGVGILSLD